MFKYCFAQHIILFLVYGLWFLDRHYMNMGYILFHAFPVFSTISTLLFAKTLRTYPMWIGTLLIVLPVMGWVILGRYVNELTIFNI